jgi:excisionase family DNA binding protein
MARANLMTASDVAVFCEVDLKTIHNWADRGHIHCFRTPGRHLRFKPEDVATFMQRQGYDVPKALRAYLPEERPSTGPRARVAEVLGDGSVTLTIGPADAEAFRAMQGRDVVLALAPTGAAA